MFYHHRYFRTLEDPEIETCIILTRPGGEKGSFIRACTFACVCSVAKIEDFNFH